MLTVSCKSDVEKGNNLMLTRLTPVATLVFCVWFRLLDFCVSGRVHCGCGSVNL